MDKEIAESEIDPVEVIKIMLGAQKYLNEEDNLDVDENGKRIPNPMLRKTLTVPELQLLLDDPVIKSDYSRTDMDREAVFYSSMKKLNRLVQLSRDKKIPPINYQSYTIYTYPMGGLISTSAGHGMFEALIRFLGTDEQIKTLAKDKVDYKIIGCYSQTEMGHGSDVRGLQTTATFDPSQDCFIINTPTIKDAKFWPGELGKLATHAVFQAKTILKGEDIGVQSFVCQIRNMDDHRPLKGLEIGDIGPKFAYAAKDNGYLYFKNFKIPRTAMLSRYAEITKEGDFMLKGDPRVAYAAMMLIRMQLIDGTPAYFIKALIYALRYVYQRKSYDSSDFYSKFSPDGSLRSRDSIKENNKLIKSVKEYQVLDYQATQAVLTSACAFAWVSKFTAIKCTQMYDKMMDEVKADKFSTMKELHSFACAIKAYYMDEVINQLKSIREIMGGHGFLLASGIAELNEMVSPNATLEGDACVMYQQTARDIFKSIGKIMKGKQLKGTYAYLNDLSDIMNSKYEKNTITELTDLIEVLKANTILQIIRVGNELRKDETISFDMKWNKLYLHDIIKTAKLHSIYSSAMNCYEGIQQTKMSNKLKETLILLCKIYACDNIVKFGDQTLVDNYLTAKQLLSVQEMLSDLLAQFRPYLAVMTEPISLCENSIEGILSQKDDKMYERLYSFSSRSALNKKDILDSFKTSVKPLQKKLSVSKPLFAKI